jgi:ATPase subunit of ABC transporter with duplicated ATPase domains
MSATVKPRTSYVTTPKATLAPRQPPTPGSERGAPAVDVRGFSFWYGERQVLRELEFEIERKAVTAIIGPSAAGSHLPALHQSVSTT